MDKKGQFPWLYLHREEGLSNWFLPLSHVSKMDRTGAKVITIYLPSWSDFWFDTMAFARFEGSLFIDSHQSLIGSALCQEPYFYDAEIAKQQTPLLCLYLRKMVSFEDDKGWFKKCISITRIVDAFPIKHSTFESKLDTDQVTRMHQ